MATILIGTAGWSYPDWRGSVYPRGAPRDFDPLAFLARHLDLVEINSSFYRLPDPAAAAGWLRRTREHPEFRFLIKAPQSWTHAPPPIPAGSLETLRAVAETIAAARRLGALLLQFPWSFRNTEANRARVAALVAALAGLPVAVEVRHSSFADSSWWRLLDELGAWPVNVDQPPGTGLALEARRGADGAYFRLHGRNSARWFDPEAGRDARYDYLYDETELGALAAAIGGAAAGKAPVFVVLNNHFRGQAAANALELRHRLSGRRQEVPPDLLRLYPRLARVAAPPRAGQGELFGG